MLHKNSASPLCDWQVKNFIFLTVYLTGSGSPQPKEEKPLTLEDVRAVCADKSRQGFTAEVKAILTKHGADKLSEVDQAEYKALLAEVEVLDNAG